MAPYLAFAPAFAAFVALPFGPDLAFEPRLNVGVFWILAILSVEVMGVILAGWASNNKWSVYGAMREACQMVSYEIPLGISIIIGVMTAGTLNLVKLGHLQAGGIHTWLIFRNPFAFIAFFVFFVASLASNSGPIRPAGVRVGSGLRFHTESAARSRSPSSPISACSRRRRQSALSGRLHARSGSSALTPLPRRWLGGALAAVLLNLVGVGTSLPVLG